MGLVPGADEPLYGEEAALPSGARPSSPLMSPLVKGLHGALSRRAPSRLGCSRGAPVPGRGGSRVYASAAEARRGGGRAERGSPRAAGGCPAGGAVLHPRRGRDAEPAGAASSAPRRPRRRCCSGGAVAAPHTPAELLSTVAQPGVSYRLS